MCRMLLRSPDRILSYRNFSKSNVIESSNEKWKLMTKIFMKFEFNKSVFSAFWSLKTGKALDNHFCFIPNPASPLIFIQTFTLEIPDKFLSGLVIQERLYNTKIFTLLSQSITNSSSKKYIVWWYFLSSTFN